MSSERENRARAAARARLERQMAARREAARKSRNFKEADELRDRLKELGAAVEDSASGPRIKPL